MTPRPRTLYLLTTVFAWSLFKSLDLLIRGRGSADFVLFDHVGLGWVAVAALVAIAVADAAALGSLFRNSLRPHGVWICLASIGLSAVFTSAGMAIARLYPDEARRAYLISRTARGLPVREDAIDAMADPNTALWLWAGSLAVSALLALLVVRERGWFTSQSS